MVLLDVTTSAVPRPIGAARDPGGNAESACRQKSAGERDARRPLGWTVHHRYDRTARAAPAAIGGSTLMSTGRPSWTNRRLPEFLLEWRLAWRQPELAPENYIDYEGGLPHVLAAAWLFCPETVEYRDGIFLKDRFAEPNADRWFTELAEITPRVEAMINHVELWGVFGNTDLTGDDRLGEDLPQLATAIGECWQGVLSLRHPEKIVTVEVSDEDDGAYGPTITFWSKPSARTARRTS